MKEPHILFFNKICVCPCEKIFVIHPLTLNIYINDSKNEFICPIILRKRNNKVSELSYCNPELHTYDDVAKLDMPLIVVNLKFNYEYGIDNANFDKVINEINQNFLNEKTYIYTIIRTMEILIFTSYKKIFLIDESLISIFIYIAKYDWLQNRFIKNLDSKILEFVLSYEYISNFMIYFLNKNQRKIRTYFSIMEELKRIFLRLIFSNKCDILLKKRIL